jgi:hypothetical protein
MVLAGTGAAGATGVCDGSVPELGKSDLRLHAVSKSPRTSANLGLTTGVKLGTEFRVGVLGFAGTAWPMANSTAQKILLTARRHASVHHRRSFVAEGKA